MVTTAIRLDGLARLAVTCGFGLNGAMASAVNMLDDVHGGAGEQAAERYGKIGSAMEATLGTRKEMRVPMSIDGATAVICAELGFAGPLARGLVCLP